MKKKHFAAGHPASGKQPVGRGEPRLEVSSLQDLADIVGVSRATVSRALNDSALVNERTKKEIQALAREHNYVANKQARDFRLKRTRMISVVFMLDADSDQHPSDPFFLEMLGGIADGLAARDYDLLLAHARMSSMRDLGNSQIVRKAEGVIFVGQGEKHEVLNQLADAGSPIVVWGEPAADKRYLLVGGDNAGGGFSAASHLLAQGRRRIAFFGNLRTPENRARFRGYEKALAQADLRPEEKLTVEVPSEMRCAQVVIENFLNEKINMDAIICASDVMAIAAIAALKKSGLSVPGDIAVVGYDDIQIASFCSPSLTTIRQSIHQAGGVLVESVLALIGGHQVADTTLSSKLIIRESCGA